APGVRAERRQPRIPRLLPLREPPAADARGAARERRPVSLARHDHAGVDLGNGSRGPLRLLESGRGEDPGAAGRRPDRRARAGARPPGRRGAVLAAPQVALVVEGRLGGHGAALAAPERNPPLPPAPGGCEAYTVTPQR